MGAALEVYVTAPTDIRQLVSSFLAARDDPDADAVALMSAGFTFESSLMRFDDRQSYLDRHRAFQKLVRGTTMISELFGSNEAILLYDLDTATPVGMQRTAEHITFAPDGVASVRLLFDASPWRQLIEA